MRFSLADLGLPKHVTVRRLPPFPEGDESDTLVVPGREKAEPERYAVDLVARAIVTLQIPEIGIPDRILKQKVKKAFQDAVQELRGFVREFVETGKTRQPKPKKGEE